MLASCLNCAPTRSFSHTCPITSSTCPPIAPCASLMCLCHLLPYLANTCRRRYISIKMHCVTLQCPSLALALLLCDSLITHTSPFHYSRLSSLPFFSCRVCRPLPPRRSSSHLR